MAGKARIALVALIILGALFVSGGSVAAGRKPTPPSPACPMPPSELCTSYAVFGVKWPTRTITYFVNETGAPAGFSAAIQAGFDEWEYELKSPEVESAYAGDRSNIDFVYGGPTARSSEVQGDGFNVVGYASGLCANCAFVNYRSRRGSISEADITFSTNLGPSPDVFMTDVTCPTLDCNKYDIQSIAAHEVGHFIGLAHVSSESEAGLVMHPSTMRNEIRDRTIAAGDVRGVRFLYP